MKRFLPLLALLSVLIAFVGTLLYLYDKSTTPEVVLSTEVPFVTDIIVKTVATGAIVPRDEVEIKPRVSGVVEMVAVEAGDTVAAGDLIATIKIIPDALALSSARAALKTAEINLADAEQAVDRDRHLAEQGALSSVELQSSVLRFALRKQEREAAASNLRLIREGAAGGQDVNTEVRATVGGMVLAVSVKVGQSVIESNNFNAGTTIAVIADMTDLIFRGNVDESEVGRISEGMPIELTIGAFGDRNFAGTLEHIAPRGVLDQGAVQFEIRAAVTPPEDVFVRAGVSANADIVLQSQLQVLAVREAVLQFEEEAVYVEVETAPQTFTRRDIEVGLSDGINIEVLSGLSEADRIKTLDL